MGLLDDLLGQLGGGAAAPAPRRQPQPAPGGGNLDMGRIVMALLPVVLGMLAQRGQGPAGGQRGGGLGGALGEALGGGGGLGGALGGALGRGAGGSGGGGLGDVLGGLLGGGSGSAGGGLGGLLEQFQRAGFGAQAQSWVGTGQNEPISGEAVEQVFGPGALGEIARRAGLSVAETSQGLAQILPEVVDRVTPSGQVPDEGTLTASVASLIARLDAGGGGPAPRH